MWSSISWCSSNHTWTNWYYWTSNWTIFASNDKMYFSSRWVEYKFIDLWLKKVKSSKRKILQCIVLLFDCQELHRHRREKSGNLIISQVSIFTISIDTKILANVHHVLPPLVIRLKCCSYQMRSSNSEQWNEFVNEINMKNGRKNRRINKKN